MRAESPRYSAVLAFGIALAACSLASVLTAQARFGAITIQTTPVPLDPHSPTRTAFGDFHYRGGLALTSPETDQLHELSDLVMTGEDRIAAVGDEGTYFEARLVLDDQGRLVGVADAHLTQLLGIDGRPLRAGDRDAEGLALLRGGDRLVSFEGNSRIWRYPKDGGRPQPARWPMVSMPANAGMEALTENPDAGNDAYIVGAEDSGDTWNCRLATPCIQARSVDKSAEFGLVAMTHLPGGLIAYLLRAYDPVLRSRISLRIMRGKAVVSRLEMAQPLTVDNFEGVASWPQPEGRRRFYLISDDNNISSQRTLLMAFDWYQPR